FDWNFLPMMKCDPSSLTESSGAVPSNANPIYTLTNNVPTKITGRVKCSYTLEFPNSDSIEALFKDTSTSTTLGLKVTDSNGAVLRLYEGFTSKLQKEMDFRFPATYKINWAECEMKTCFVSGSCDGGPEKQLKLSKKPIDTCENGVMIDFISPYEWQITLVGQHDKIQNFIELTWANTLLLSCGLSQTTEVTTYAQGNDITKI
ncbi:hypothetical protein PFISCL1PPCAC_6637, partial [Pristionchus fissidentatus]